MVKKLKETLSAKAANARLSGSVKDSAQQIWQAGLGAFTRAQAEGSKAFEALVKEGVSMQRKTQAAAEEKILEATSKMSSMANGFTSKATVQWDKLESIFEERVAKALHKLGVPSAQDVDALVERIDELSKAVQKLSAKAPAAEGATQPKTKAKAATAKTKAAAKRPAAAPAKAGAKAAPKRTAARKTTPTPSATAEHAASKD